MKVYCILLQVRNRTQQDTLFSKWLFLVQHSKFILLSMSNALSISSLELTREELHHIWPIACGPSPESEAHNYPFTIKPFQKSGCYYISKSKSIYKGTTCIMGCSASALGNGCSGVHKLFAINGLGIYKWIVQ